MLSKGINLNLKIGRSDFSKAIGFSIAGWTLSILLAKAMTALIGPLVLLVCSIATIVFSIKGLNKIFSTSLFDAEGSFYMALPLSEREIVMSKVLAGSIYMLLISLVALAASLVMVLFFDVDVTDIGVEVLKEYLNADVPPMQIGILMGLLPLKMLLQQVFFCTFAFTVLLSFHLIKPDKLAVPAWLVIYGINFAITTGAEFLCKTLLKNGFNSLLLEGLTDGFYIVVIAGLFTYCVKALNSKFNM